MFSENFYKMFEQYKQTKTRHTFFSVKLLSPTGSRL